MRVSKRLKAQLRRMTRGGRLVIIDKRGLRYAPDRSVRTPGSILGQSAVRNYDRNGWPDEF